MTVFDETQRDPRVTTTALGSFSEFSEAISQSLVPVDLAGRVRGAFRGSVRTAEVGSVQFSDIMATGHEAHRSDAQIAAAPASYYKVHVQLVGTGLVVQDGRETVLKPGELAIYDTSRPFSLAFEKEFRTLVVMIPRAQLRLSPERVAQVTAVTFSDRGSLGAVAIPCLARMANGLDEFSRPSGSRLCRSALGLIATVLEHELEHSYPGDPRSRLLDRIHLDIESDLGKPGLSPASIAAAHFISVRNLNGLFQGRGTTVSQWVRERRLEKCRQDLSDPLLSARPVSSVGARWGFTDPAHFSRVFKSAYGMSPAEFRASSFVTAPARLSVAE